MPILVPLMASVPALVQQPPPPPPPGPRLEPPFLKVAQELGLSEAQQAKLKALLEAHHESLRAKHDALREAHMALMDAVHGSGTPDLAALNQALAACQLALVTEARELYTASVAVLTESQRAKSTTLRARRPGRPEGPDRQDRSDHPQPPRD